MAAKENKEQTELMQSSVVEGVQIYDEIVIFLKRYDGIDPSLMATVFGNILFQICVAMKMSPKEFEISLGKLIEIYELKTSEENEHTIIK